MSDQPLVGSTKVELVRAHLGTVSLTGIGGTPVKMGLRRAVLHPQYNPGTLDFDVAVLELARPLGFNTFIQPVCLPLAIQKFPVGRKCMISGWGSTREGNGELPAGVSGPLLQGPQAPAHGRSAAAFSTFLGPQPCPFVESRSPGGFPAARACAPWLFAEKLRRHLWCTLQSPPKFMLALEPQSGLLAGHPRR